MSADQDKVTVVGEIELAPGAKYPLEAKTRTKRGSGGSEQYTLLRPNVPAEQIIELLRKKLNEGGNLVFENFLLREVFIPSCNEATSECWVTDPATGEVSVDESKYTQAFWDTFVPSDRRRGTGVTKKDLETQLQAVMPEFTVAVEERTKAEHAYMAAAELCMAGKGPKPDKAAFISEELSNKVAQLLLEVNTLTAKIEHKSRPGSGPKGPRKPRAKKESVEAVTA